MDRREVTRVICDFGLDNLKGPLAEAPAKLLKQVQEVISEHPNHRNFTLEKTAYYGQTSWEVSATRDETDEEMNRRLKLQEHNIRKSKKAAEAQLAKLKKEHPELFKK